MRRYLQVQRIISCNRYINLASSKRKINSNQPNAMYPKRLKRPTKDDVCIICQDSTGARVDRCNEYDCKCRGIFFHDTCFQEYEGFACPICRDVTSGVPDPLFYAALDSIDPNSQDIIRNMTYHMGTSNVRHMLREFHEAQDARLHTTRNRLGNVETTEESHEESHEEDPEERHQHICNHILGVILLLVYMSEMYYAWWALDAWNTYSKYQNFVLFFMIVNATYFICRTCLSWLIPVECKRHQNRFKKTFFCFDFISFALCFLTNIAYLNGPTNEYLRISTGIHAGLSLTALSIVCLGVCCRH